MTLAVPNYVEHAPPLTVFPDPAGAADEHFSASPGAGYPGGQAVYALVINSSAYTVLVDVGGRPLGRLPAGISNAYGVGRAGTPIGITVPAGTPVSPSTAPQQVLITWQDTPPAGSWPSGINTQSIAAAIAGYQSQTILNHTVNAGAVFSRPFTPIPSFTETLTLYITGAAGCSAEVTVSGQASGFQYLPQQLFATNTFPTFPAVYLTIDGQLDPNLSFTVDNSAGTGSISIIAVASSAPPGKVTTGRNFATTQTAEISVASPASGTLLISPGPLAVFEVELLEVNAGTTAFSTAGSAFLAPLSTAGAILLGSYAQATAIFLTKTGPFYLADGITYHNSSGQTANFTVVYRVIDVGDL